MASQPFRFLIIASLLALPSLTSAAEYYDGRHTLLCTVFEIFQCSIGSDCSQATPQELGSPRYFHVDFENDRLVTTEASPEARMSAIRSQTNIDDTLILQGHEDGEADVRDGAGWTLSISDPEGAMAFSAVRGDTVISSFGACVPID